jgi:hypothetical protein
VSQEIERVRGGSAQDQFDGFGSGAGQDAAGQSANAGSGSGDESHLIRKDRACKDACRVSAADTWRDRVRTCT